MRLIDADALKKAFTEECCGCCDDCSHCIAGYECELIDKAPTVELLMARMVDGVIILICNGKVVQVVPDNLQEWRPDHD